MLVGVQSFSLDCPGYLGWFHRAECRWSCSHQVQFNGPLYSQGFNPSQVVTDLSYDSLMEFHELGSIIVPQDDRQATNRTIVSEPVKYWVKND